MRELSLFSGAGGGLLGTKLLGWECIGYVEFNEYCQKVLRARIDDGILDEAPIFSDIRAFLSEGYADAYSGLVDIVTAGFPCQPFSSAARGRNDSSKDMWPECFEVIKRVKPRACLLENVSYTAIKRAAIQLKSTGYTTHSAQVSAAAVGAPHIRKREWLLAHTNNKGESTGGFDDEVGILENAARCAWWDADKPTAVGVDDGLADRVERFKAIGNGQVPAVVREAWRLLTGEN